MSRVVVCGSLNMDVVVQSARRPATGETLLGATVSFLPGGKGLNQAVAAARLGVPTAMIGAVGNDAFGNSLRSFLASEDVDATGVREINGPATGVALIQVNWTRVEGYDNEGAWDTHGNHCPCAKGLLMPMFDRTFSALIEDLRAFLRDHL